MNDSVAYIVVYWGALIGSALLALLVLISLIYLFFGERKLNLSFKYESFMAKRFLMAKRSHKAVSIITIISIFAVMFASAGMVIVMSVMNGFSSDFRDKILGANPHVMLMRYGQGLPDYQKILDKTQNIAGVLRATPFVLGEGMLSSKYNMTGAVIKSISAQDKELLESLEENILDNDLKNLSSQDIIIGREMAKVLKVFTGNFISLVTPFSELGPMGMMPKSKSFRVVGLFHTGMYEYDSKFAYTNLESAQSLFGLGDLVSGIEYKVKDPNLSAEAAEKIDNILGGYPFYVRDWMEMNRPLFSALKLEKIAMFIILMTLVSMASLLILVTLIMVVLEKGKEIAILKSMGATDTSIMKIFVTYGLTIGGLGTLLGLFLGLIICWLLSSLGIGLDAEVYYISQIPVKIDYFEVSLVALGALVVSFLATIPPSFFAARLKPVDGLRYE